MAVMAAGKGAAMLDAEVFIHVAEIAGVFVAFGALIAVRSGGASGRIEVGYTRGIVGFGVLAMLAGLAPVALGFFALAEHRIWALSSALLLAAYVLFLAYQVRTPEYRANMRDGVERARSGQPARWSVAAGEIVSGLYALALLLLPIIILLGVAPTLEAGLYFGTAVLILLCAAWLLLDLVFQPRPRAQATDGLREGGDVPPGASG